MRVNYLKMCLIKGNLTKIVKYLTDVSSKLSKSSTAHYYEIRNLSPLSAVGVMKWFNLLDDAE